MNLSSLTQTIQAFLSRAPFIQIVLIFAHTCFKLLVIAAVISLSQWQLTWQHKTVVLKTQRKYGWGVTADMFERFSKNSSKSQLVVLTHMRLSFTTRCTLKAAVREGVKPVWLRSDSQNWYIDLINRFGSWGPPSVFELQWFLTSFILSTRFTSLWENRDQTHYESLIEIRA